MANHAHLRGASSEAFVASAMFDLGYEVFLPMMPQSRIDMILHKDGKNYPVQVKTFSTLTNGKNIYKQVRLEGRKNKYTRKYRKKEFKWLIMTDLEKVWMIPWKLVWDKTSFTVSKSSRKRDWNPNDYII